MNHEGVYTFQYKVTTDKRAQFRFVNNNDGNLSVNFVLEGSETLHQLGLKLADGNNTNAEKYLKYLKSATGEKQASQSTQPNYRPGNLEPVPLEPTRPIFEPSRPPLLIGPSSSGNNPFPGGGLFNPNGELVGPDSQIFQGRGGYSNPYGYGGDNPLRIPPGARYDPVHPFDTRGQGLNPDRSDFFGFDEFGQPLRRQPPGFGGQGNRGMGGGFGGGSFGGNGPRFF